MDHTGIMTAETGTYRYAGALLRLCCRWGLLSCGQLHWRSPGGLQSLEKRCRNCGNVQQRSSLLRSTAPCVSRRWMAPEVIEHNPYKEKADVFRWGLEVLLVCCSVPAHGAALSCCDRPPCGCPTLTRLATSSQPSNPQLWDRAVGAAHGPHPLQRHDAAAGGGGCGAEGAAPAHPAKLPAAAVRPHAAVLAARPQRAALL